MGRRVDKLRVRRVVDVGLWRFGGELVIVFFEVVPEGPDVARVGGTCDFGLVCFSELAGNDGRGGSNVLSEQQHMVQRRASISFQVSAQLSMKSAVL